MIKSVALLLIMAIALVLLTGCGGNKLVATKTTEDGTIGKYKEEMTVTFKDDKVNEIEMSMEFDDEEKAKAMYSLYNVGASMSDDESLKGMKVEQKGKKLVIKMDAKAYAESAGVSEDAMTKDALKSALEAQGYEVK